MFDKAEEYYLRAFQNLFESHNNQLRLDDEWLLRFLEHLSSLYLARRISQQERMASLGTGNTEALTEAVFI